MLVWRARVCHTGWPRRDCPLTQAHWPQPCLRESAFHSCWFHCGLPSSPWDSCSINSTWYSPQTSVYAQDSKLRKNTIWEVHQPDYISSSCISLHHHLPSHHGKSPLSETIIPVSNDHLKLRVVDGPYAEGTFRERRSCRATPNGIQAEFERRCSSFTADKKSKKMQLQNALPCPNLGHYSHSWSINTISH